MSENVIDRVRQVTKSGAAKALGAIPSPEGCGCGKRKRQMQSNLRGDKNLKSIIGDLVNDLRGKEVSSD